MNCIIIDDDEASRAMLTQLISQVDNLKLTGSYSNGKDALSLLKSNSVNLVFLDIEMPGLTGLEILAGMEIKPLVIITSSNEKYAIEAFQYNVIEYLVKPINPIRFLKAINKAEKKLEKDNGIIDSNSTDYIFFRKDCIITKIAIRDILWVEALGDYITINTKAKKYVLHQTLKSVEIMLPGNKFIRVHRSFIVQKDNISTIEDTTIYLDGTHIP